MLTCDGNENCEQKLNKVLYWETPLGDSALIIQPLPICIPLLTEDVPLEGQKARNADRTRMFTKAEWFKSTNLTIFVAIYEKQSRNI